MTKNFTLLMLFIFSALSIFSKNGFQIEEFDISSLGNTSAKINTNAFRYEQTDYLVIQPNINTESYLKENGINVQNYLGNGYYLIASNSSQTQSSLQKIATSKIGYLSSISKIDNQLKSVNNFTQISVLYASAIDISIINSICQKNGIAVNLNNQRNNYFTTYANAAQIEKLSQYPFIYFITKSYPSRNPLIYDASIMIGANEIQESQPYGYNLKGENVNVGIWDEGVVGQSFDLPNSRNFVVDKEENKLASTFHPTEVAGCIGGAGNIFGTLKGIAPKCNMFYWDVYNDIVNEINDGKAQYNIDISNHSYNFAATTCSESGTYIPEAADLDKLVFDNPTMLPIIAVGNTASTNCAIATDTFSSVDIGFQGCKNVITVGWLFSNEKIVENSGRGPTSDGRLKPELVAKGFAVSSILGTVYGSSYSAPIISGLTALCYEKYKQQFGLFPSASLIKSILCNTATDLGKAGPDYIYGFGKPYAKKAIKSIENNLFFENNISQDNFISQSISIPSNINKLSVTLCWTDKEGNPVADKSLVNDLDLKLVTPNGDTILPWVLNPNIPKNIALRGIDKINNIEQVTLSTVPAGTYTIVVKGTSIPFGPQNYAVSYYAQEKKIELSNPNGGEVLDNSSQTNIRWNNNGIDSIGKIEFSTDNGVSWQTIINSIQLSNTTYSWTLPSTTVSNQCLIKITSGNNIAISAAPFTIGAQVFYPSINHTICDGTIKINWPAVVDASGYRIYLISDSSWVNVGQTSLNTFTIDKLVNGRTYMYSISVVKNNVEGNHSYAKSFTPLPNSCTTLNDVGVYAIYKPIGGRKFTSSALTSTEKLSFIIKNYGTTTQNSISVSYKINNGAIRTATLIDVMPTNDTSIIKFTINENLSAIGNYDVVAWTNLVGDNNLGNDTLKYTIKHLQNAPLILPFLESFESSNSVVLTNSLFGIKGIDYVDYYCEQGGRLRTNESNSFTKNGKIAITLDNYLNTGITKKNELVFTYNLSNYIDTLIYLDVNFMNRAEVDGDDTIYARGDDTKPWVPILDLLSYSGIVGKYKNVAEINLYKLLKIDHGQSFSSSTQLKIVQQGKNAALSAYGNGGYTFDDFKLYLAGNDVAILTTTINKIQCSKSASVKPLTILIKNNTSQAITNLPVSFKINNDATVNEFVPIVNANDTVSYTFNSLINKTNVGLYTIKTWVSNVGDNYRLNDSINTTSIIVMQTVDSFPYYNDFETNNGNLLSEGTNNSWVWGTPAKFNINNAAQDNKAWTTGLERGYNFNEDSYLYLGCLDFSSLTKDPLIAFNFISVMQTGSDSAYAEYSTNGTNWSRLGCYNCGLNWYNGFNNKPYWDRIIFPWQTAHITVPLDLLVDKSNFMYRIRLKSDDFAVAEGLGIDDIHILNDYQDMATADSAYITEQSTGNGWIKFFRNGKLIAELFDDNKNLGNVRLGFEANISKQKQFNNANILPRNWVVKPQNSIVGNYKLRLYILNPEYTTYILNEDSISRMGDIRMLRYIGLNTNLDIFDNHVTSYYKYFTPQEIQFYPYQNGYYVEFNTDTLGEFYLISTKQDKDAIQNVNLIDFSAQKLDDDVYLNWETTREINSKSFVIQYSFDAQTFIDIDTLPAGGFSTNITPYNYLHQLNASIGIYYYRIKMVDNSNRFTYSLIDSVYFAPNVGFTENTTSIKTYITTNDIVVEFKNKLQTPSTINVYNSLGQLQFTTKLQLVNGVNPLGITDFLHWSNSAYYLQIQTPKTNYYSKLMKQ